MLTLNHQNNQSAGKFQEQGGWAFLGRTKLSENVVPAPALSTNQNHENRIVFDDFRKTENRRAATGAPQCLPECRCTGSDTHTNPES
jgi:hypothetical protein